MLYINYDPAWLVCMLSIHLSKYPAVVQAYAKMRYVATIGPTHRSFGRHGETLIGRLGGER